MEFPVLRTYKIVLIVRNYIDVRCINNNYNAIVDCDTLTFKKKKTQP